MENYIIRIYRRDECRLDGVVGLVEMVETGEIRFFHKLAELASILAMTLTMDGETAAEKPSVEPV